MEGRITLSPERLVNLWKDCIRCEIGQRAYKHVFWRGDIPCDVLFIGEAPGRTEDLEGRPFTGTSGQLLDKLIDRARPRKKQIRIGFTNVVSCRPSDDEDNNRSPIAKEIENCSPRLLMAVKIMNPKIIVLLGNVATASYNTMLYSGLKKANGLCMVYKLAHPSYILRCAGQNDPLEIEQAKIFSDKLNEAFKHV